jgi:ATP-dependent Lhr-like helicase
MLDTFHPAVQRWFKAHFEKPTPPQAQAWPSIAAGQHTLIAAPTGSGKTFAAFLAAIDDLVRQSVAGTLADTTQVVYVSPLKALSNDIRANLQRPLAGILAELEAVGVNSTPIRTLVRTGDTPAAERTAMTRRPPHILVTTPESLYILLTSEGGRKVLSTTRYLILDEIHALVSDKRGSHLSLSVERLEELAGRKLIRVGLSATQKPLDEVARYLVGAHQIEPDGTPRCNIIDAGHRRQLDLAIEVPGSPLEAVMSNEVWEELYDRLALLTAEHKTTLIFVNTRRMAERVARHLGERIGDDQVTSHHGSLARHQRLNAEQRLKRGELRALVATASLELGIDIGSIDLVCQIGSTRAISTLLQRVGRSGHTLGGFPKGRLFPLSRDELVENVAIIDAVHRGELDRLNIPEEPLDILAQQIVASVAAGEWGEDELFQLVRRSYSFRNLAREKFDDVVKMLSEGYTTRRGRSGAYIHRDAVNRRLRPRRGARLAAITSGGAIPDTADYTVTLEPSGINVGTLNEDFAVESLAGDIFQLGNTSYRILRVEPGRVRVSDAHGQPPTIPFWLGEAPGRTAELSMAVSNLRQEVSTLLANGNEARVTSILMERLKLGESAVTQTVEYLAAGQAGLGAMPTHDRIIAERFFDETGGTQLVIHSPFGSRLNRAWGLALRKRFCRTFNFELQAAATEDAIIFSMGPTQSFPLRDVFDFLKSKTVRDVLIQALLDAPMFTVRWRWNAGRSLAVLRYRGGRKVPPQLQRMNAEDLLCLVFPEQLACAENLTGAREVPDHPLVFQTIRDCLEEAMDIEGLERLLRSIESGEKHLVAVESRSPSAFSQEILTAKPYAYLDDAPLEERRTQAVLSRRWLTPDAASDVGSLDPAAIARVREEVWPQVRSADELHDALLQLGFVTEAEGSKAEEDWRPYLAELVANGRSTVVRRGEAPPLWVAAENLSQFRAVLPHATYDPSIVLPPELDVAWSASDALTEIVRGRLEGLGPVTAGSLAASLGLSREMLEAALLGLESEGFVLRGSFTPGSEATEWCSRRLLARINAYTLTRLRREIEPVSSADFVRFLLEWQHATPEHAVSGADGLSGLMASLEGFEAPAAAWEADILPTRVSDYDPAWLDALCLAGKLTWRRLPASIQRAGTGLAGPIRSTPIRFLLREYLHLWDALAPDMEMAADATLSANAKTVDEFLLSHGASFFSDIVSGTRLPASMVEVALGELVARGLVTSDSFTGLRALLLPATKAASRQRRRIEQSGLFNIGAAGRWVLVRPSRHPGPELRLEAIEHVARTLLKRYGVVFRRLLERESLPTTWRDLLTVFRRLEARGEIRGGRFVGGFSGEQFALADAIPLLRSVRRAASSELVSVSGADPVNLVGVATPGARLPAVSSNRVLYRGGEPVALFEARQISFLVEFQQAERWSARNALIHRNVPPQLRAYLSNAASAVNELEDTAKLRIAGS